jgi:hypothetical protein
MRFSIGLFGVGAEVGRLGLEGGGDDGSSFRGRKCVGWDRDDLSNVGIKFGADHTIGG